MSNKTNIYFIGIGGIGMSALARYFVASGNKVSGYDKTPSEITKALENIGVKIHFEDDINAIPLEFKNHHQHLLFIHQLFQNHIQNSTIL